MARLSKSHKAVRHERVAEQMRRDLAELMREIKDPRLAPLLPLVSLTAVEVSSDYAHAKVYWTSLAGHEHDAEIAAGLTRSAGFLRRELGRRLTIHHIPELKFVFDASIERGSEISRLIDEAVAGRRDADE